MQKGSEPRRVALVHDWLTGMRGGERVLEVMLDLWPRAEIFTLIHVPGSVSPKISERPLHTSFVDRLPFAHRGKPVWLPLYPMAIEGFDLTGFDLVVSTSHCVAKSVLAAPDAVHVCYCFSPMRYAYDQGPVYRAAVRPAWLRPIWDLVMAGLRTWDAATAARPDVLVAISGHTAARIRRHYRRDALVLPAPVDLSAFPMPGERGPGDYYLVFSALVPYKRIDLAVRAAPRLPYPLVVAGTGQEETRLRRMAGDRVRFLGRIDDSERGSLLAGCRALLFPGEEDFGLVPLEANAVGRPVVGYARGGLGETQVEGETAVLFEEQSVDALVDAVARAETVAWDPGRIRANAERFSIPAFREGFARIVAEAWEARRRT